MKLGVTDIKDDVAKYGRLFDGGVGNSRQDEAETLQPWHYVGSWSDFRTPCFTHFPLFAVFHLHTLRRIWPRIDLEVCLCNWREVNVEESIDEFKGDPKTDKTKTWMIREHLQHEPKRNRRRRSPDTGLTSGHPALLISPFCRVRGSGRAT